MKLIVSILIMLVGLFLFTPPAFALDCSVLTDSCVPGDPFCGTAPSPVQIICPIIRIVNVLLTFAAIVFLVMLGFGAIKMSAALGDPKGLDSASKTWTYAFLGLFIVLGAVTIFTILNTTLGLGFAQGIDINTWFENSLINFMTDFLLIEFN